MATLEVLRNRLAAQIDATESGRDLAALSLRLTDVLEQIASCGGGDSSEIAAFDELKRRRVARGGLKPPRSCPAPRVSFSGAGRGVQRSRYFGS